MPTTAQRPQPIGTESTVKLLNFRSRTGCFAGKHNTIYQYVYQKTSIIQAFSDDSQFAAVAKYGPDVYIIRQSCAFLTATPRTIHI
jgi:hypothetical protein